MDPRLEPLGDGEREWIESHLRIARSFVALYTGVEPSDALPTPEALDAAWTAWLREWERFDPNHIINAVGMVLGEHLIAAVGLAWCFVSRTTGFIAPLLEQMVLEIRRIRAEE